MAKYTARFLGFFLAVMNCVSLAASATRPWSEEGSLLEEVEEFNDGSTFEVVDESYESSQAKKNKNESPSEALDESMVDISDFLTAAATFHNGAGLADGQRQAKTLQGKAADNIIKSQLKRIILASDHSPLAKWRAGAHLVLLDERSSLELQADQLKGVLAKQPRAKKHEKLEAQLAELKKARDEITSLLGQQVGLGIDPSLLPNSNRDDIKKIIAVQIQVLKEQLQSLRKKITYFIKLDGTYASLFFTDLRTTSEVPHLRTLCSSAEEVLAFIKSEIGRLQVELPVLEQQLQNLGG